MGLVDWCKPTSGLRIKILQGSDTGSSVYEETYLPTTNAYGLVNLQLGTGTVQSGTFSSIDWGNGPYFVETAADVSGGTSYVTLSTTQFMSVPYALYAKNAGLDSAAVQAMIDALGVVGVVHILVIIKYFLLGPQVHQVILLQ